MKDLQLNILLSFKELVKIKSFGAEIILLIYCQQRGAG